MKFHIIFRFTKDEIAARSADFPHLNATGHTVPEVEGKMRDAIRKHVEGLQGQNKRGELFEPRLPPVAV